MRPTDLHFRSPKEKTPAYKYAVNVILLASYSTLTNLLI